MPANRRKTKYALSDAMPSTRDWMARGLHGRSTEPIGCRGAEFVAFSRRNRMRNSLPRTRRPRLHPSWCNGIGRSGSVCPRATGVLILCSVPRIPGSAFVCLRGIVLGPPGRCLGYRAGVAQLVEHLICNQTVGGSNPFASSTQSAQAAFMRLSQRVRFGIFWLGHETIRALRKSFSGESGEASQSSAVIPQRRSSAEPEISGRVGMRQSAIGAGGEEMGTGGRVVNGSRL